MVSACRLTAARRAPPFSALLQLCGMKKLREISLAQFFQPSARSTLRLAARFFFDVIRIVSEIFRQCPAFQFDDAIHNVVEEIAVV